MHGNHYSPYHSNERKRCVRTNRTNKRVGSNEEVRSNEQEVRGYAMQSVDDLAILSSIGILWCTGKNCMAITTPHITTNERGAFEQVCCVLLSSWQRGIVRVLLYYSFRLQPPCCHDNIRSIKIEYKYGTIEELKAQSL
jgi:hypothetical protein